jgi:hypothetical protein
MGHGFLRFWDTDSQDTCTCGESAGVNTDFFWIIGHRYTLLPIGVLREGTMSRIGTDFFGFMGHSKRFRISQIHFGLVTSLQPNRFQATNQSIPG